MKEGSLLRYYQQSYQRNLNYSICCLITSTLTKEMRTAFAPLPPSQTNEFEYEVTSVALTSIHDQKKLIEVDATIQHLTKEI
jgi:hypothetical protein